MRVLLLEDDPKIRRAYAERLRRDGHAVDELRTLRTAREAVVEVDYDLLVLDRLVPDGDSIALVEELRSQGNWVPVLVLSGLGDSDARIEGLRLGADDYLAKPARLDEIALRANRLLLRGGPRPPAPIVLGPVTVDRAAREAVLHGEVVDLTMQQFNVLEYLAMNIDRTVSAEELLDHCWDRNRSVFGNPLHSQISRLRRRFKGILAFKSVRRVGYRLVLVEGTDEEAEGADEAAGDADGSGARAEPAPQVEPTDDGEGDGDDGTTPDEAEATDTDR